jgi:hypothetical protein
MAAWRRGRWQRQPGNAQAVEARLGAAVASGSVVVLVLDLNDSGSGGRAGNSDLGKMEAATF